MPQPMVELVPVVESIGMVLMKASREVVELTMMLVLAASVVLPAAEVAAVEDAHRNVFVVSLLEER